jgi:glucose-1-phosphate adenylyltransferase
MDFRQMVEQHVETGAGVTVAAIRQPIDTADQFGVIEVADDDPRRIARFREKPDDPLPLPDAPDEVLASMGNYVFDAEALLDAVTRDSTREQSRHDMGGDIVPDFVSRGEAGVYDFRDNDVPGSTDRDRNYWRDVGTLDSYYAAHMDLISVLPVFNLYNYDWPIYTDYGPYPPAKLVHGSKGKFGEAHNSAVSPGVVISGSTVTNSVLSPRCHIHSGTTIDDSVLLDGVQVGRGCTIQRSIIDKGVVVPDDTKIGVDPEHDRARGFMVTESGLTVIAKLQPVAP